MSLDLTQVAAQVNSMAARLKAESQGRRERLGFTLELLKKQAGEFAALKKKTAASKTTWLVAGLVDGLYQGVKAPPLPPDFTVMATDGSSIDVDRNRSARCFLINTSSIVLNYGSKPGAELTSQPVLYSRDEDMVMSPPGMKHKEQLIEGTLLSIKRGVDECRQLTSLAAKTPPGSASLALVDGSLILWGLMNKDFPDFVLETLLEKGFLKCLDEFKILNNDRQAAIASYVSFPRSSDIANTLRVALCPHEVVNSDRQCSNCETRECDAVAGIQDRDLFYNTLSDGERSPLFFSQSSIVEKHYGGHRVYFFYLRLEDEIARVEIPQWVAQDEELLGLAHVLIVDQCRRGQGYPVALGEAHEQAVVTGMDRENFWQLVESSLAEERIPTSFSAKSQSKRTRWV